MNENEVIKITIIDIIPNSVIVDIKIRTDNTWTYHDGIKIPLEIGTVLNIMENQEDANSSFVIPREKRKL